MSFNWNNVKPACCARWLVLPTVYSDALSYGEQLDKFCYQLNQLIENNNIIPDFISELIKEYINSGAIGEVVRDILASYILNVKYPPNGLTPASGDGTTDDTAAIQGCIDYAAENGGVVYFPYGKYLTQALTIKSGVSLFGFDRYSTKIVLKSGANKSLLSGNAVNFSIKGMTLSANSGNQVNNVGVISVVSSDVLLSDLILTDGFNLLSYNGTGGAFQISDVVFDKATEKSVVISGNSNVEMNNTLFNSLSGARGVCVIEVNSDNGVFNFSSYAEAQICLNLNGNNNIVSALIKNAINSVNDNGENNVVNVYGEKYSYTLTGDKVVGCSNYTEKIENKKEVTATNLTENAAEKNVNITNNLTEEIGGNKKVTANTYNGSFEESTINTDELFLNVTNPIKYKKVEPFNELFGYIPFKDIDDSEYKVLTPTDKLKNLTLKYVNVKDFGATGDGVTDDTGAFELAINNIGDYAGLFIPKGTYLISRPLTLVVGKSVVGENRYTATLKLTGDFTCFSYVGNNDGFNAEISGLQFLSTDGNSSGIFMDKTSRYNIHDLLFTDMKNCVTLCRGGLCTVRDLYSQGVNYKAGNFKFGAFSGENVYSFVNSFISNLTAESVNGVVSPAFHFYYCVATKVYSLFSTIGDKTETGVQIDGDSQGLTFYGLMLTSLGEGIRVQNSNDYPKNITFIGCDIDQCKTPTIFTDGSEIFFIGGHITSSNQHTDSFAILVTDVKTLNLIGLSVGGYFTANGGGLHIFGTTECVVNVSGCNFHGNYYGILVETNNNLIARNNIFTECEKPIAGVNQDASLNSDNIAIGNIGFKPWKEFTTPAEPAGVLKNTFGVPANVVVNTDKYNSIKVNGAIFANNTHGIVSFMLNPNDTVEFTNPAEGSHFEWWWIFMQ